MQLLYTERNGTLTAYRETRRERLSSHEEVRLRLNVSAAVLPVTVTETDGIIRIAFDAEETEPLAEWFRRNRGRWDCQGDVLLGIAARIAEGILDAENHFLPPDLFTATPDGVRIRPSDEALFLVPDPGRREGAVPDADGAGRFRNELAALLDELGRGLGDTVWNAYRERLLADLRGGKGGLLSVARLLEKARGELYRPLPEIPG